MSRPSNYLVTSGRKTAYAPPQGIARPLKLRNEPEEFFTPTKRPKDPHQRPPKRKQPSLPTFKCLTED